MCRFAADLCDDEFPDFSPGRGTRIGKDYESSANSVRGCKATWNSATEEKLGEGRLYLSGTALNAADPRDRWRLCRALASQWKVRCSRIDIAFDDYTKQLLNYELIRDAGERGNYTHAAIRFTEHREFLRGRPSNGGTLYLGSRQSDKYIRFYDKEAQSKGAKKSIRFECEFKERWAESIFKDYVAFTTEQYESGEAEHYLASALSSTIDFVERPRDPSEQRASRCVRFAWWQKVLDVLGGQRLYPPKRERTSMAKKIHWTDCQLAPSLSLMADAMGWRNFMVWFTNMLDAARERRTKVGEALLRQLKGEWGEPFSHPEIELVAFSVA